MKAFHEGDKGDEKRVSAKHKRHEWRGDHGKNDTKNVINSSHSDGIILYSIRKVKEKSKYSCIAI